MTLVFFLSVQDNQTKIKRICDTVQSHFFNNETILIGTPTQDAAKFVDTMLWRFSEESFLPHTISESETSEKIAITTSQTNVNQASIFFNLCPSSCKNSADYKVIYELFDQTSHEKKRLSEERLQYYQGHGFNVTIN